MARGQTQDKPQRSCIGCREGGDRDRLLRFVVSPQGELVPDLEGKLPGRGAYTCVKARCLQAAIRQRQFNRTFKREVAVPSAERMTEMVAGLMRERILGYLGLANRAGKIVSGSSLVGDALRGASKPGLVLVALDASRSIAEKVLLLASVHGVPARRLLTKEDFGGILGKAPRSAVAVKQGGFIQRLVSEIQRYENFLGEV